MSSDLSIKIGGVIENHSARRLYPVKEDPKMKDPGDIVEYGWKQKVTKVGDGEDDYVVEDVVVEVSRVNRQQFIAKDASDVGVLNILKKVALSGDLSLLNQTGASIPEELQDYTNIPGSVGEALKALESGSKSFEGLKAIFGDTSFEQLANMSSDEIAAALQAYVASQSQNQNEEGGSK